MKNEGHCKKLQFTFYWQKRNAAFCNSCTKSWDIPTSSPSNPHACMYCARQFSKFIFLCKYLLTNIRDCIVRALTMCKSLLELACRSRLCTGYSLVPYAYCRYSIYVCNVGSCELIPVGLFGYI